mmetsp:Transcript_24240/g.50014  ORF Transcript_24240/g.50014 Transcript_24240/m.50014 type:complete len:312 (-) Transcript_24240:1598-2533(-)|eukprot:CAMPEP_0178713036 /NCGR_PEP_ID=MMETSP0699-20121125/19202_1 /TAXON_ID=265572 /ORGANISM="Extubocellulus spinifer, Strain CCMP396" /LENGTH=311 /DNA_ID=CAMNT_0020361829 /DNA_START=582 /DNA_END=1517 /DNA_ORIENTATION=+
MASSLLPKASPSSQFLELARGRLRDRFRSKFLDHAKVTSVASNASRLDTALSTPTDQATASIPKVDIASAILADEMKPNYLEDARYRIRSRYQDFFLGRFSPSRHFDAAHLNPPPTGWDVAVPLGSNWRPTDNEYVEAARMRLRARFHDKFVSTKEDRVPVEAPVTWNNITEDEFEHFPTAVHEIPAALSSSWGQTHAVVITSAHSPFRIMHVNQPWVALCGYTMDEAVGETFKSLGINRYGITERDRVEEMMSRLRRGEKAAVHLTNQNKEGDEFTNYLRIVPVADDNTGEVTRFLGVLEDVTGRKSAAA